MILLPQFASRELKVGGRLAYLSHGHGQNGKAAKAARAAAANTNQESAQPPVKQDAEAVAHARYPRLQLLSRQRIPGKTIRTLVLMVKGS
jgi:hypothetical protein